MERKRKLAHVISEGEKTAQEWSCTSMETFYANLGVHQELLKKSKNAFKRLIELAKPYARRFRRSKC